MTYMLVVTICHALNIIYPHRFITCEDDDLLVRGYSMIDLYALLKMIVYITHPCMRERERERPFYNARESL